MVPTTIKQISHQKLRIKVKEFVIICKITTGHKRPVDSRKLASKPAVVQGLTE